MLGDAIILVLRCSSSYFQIDHRGLTALITNDIVQLASFTNRDLGKLRYTSSRTGIIHQRISPQDCFEYVDGSAYQSIDSVITALHSLLEDTDFLFVNGMNETEMCGKPKDKGPGFWVLERPHPVEEHHPKEQRNKPAAQWSDVEYAALQDLEVEFPEGTSRRWANIAEAGNDRGTLVNRSNVQCQGKKKQKKQKAQYHNLV